MFYTLMLYILNHYVLYFDALKK